MRIRVNDCGEITSIYDKAHDQELAAGLCNQMRLYEDIPSQFDAWDIDSVYRLSPVDLREKASIEVLAEGPLFGKLLIRRKLNNSVMNQIITIYRDTRRVDFQTTIDWQERHKLLKVNFPVNYFARQALHEIQFGHIQRPTHRSRQADQDQFEVSNQKWTALVEVGRGFAILNDCKYSIDVVDNSINLTLLKSALAPDMYADRGIQEFTYAFYFWDTPLIESGLVQEGYELNAPVKIVAGFSGEKTLFELDQPNIIIETVKPLEANDAGTIILRLYESMGTRTQTRLSINLPCESVFQTDMLENKIKQLEYRQGVMDLAFTPFEIKTLKLQTK
jgi:alpha-mannosidase